MTAQQFDRTHPDQIGAPRVDGGIKEVPPPPTIPGARFRTYLSVILPVTLVVGIIGTIAMLFLVGARTFTGIGLFFPVMALMSVGGMVSGRFFGGGQRKSASEQEDDRTDYSRDTLDKLRGEAHKVGAAQFKRVLFFHPNPLDLWAVAGTKRMWSRDPSKRLFGEVRLGIGLSESALKLETPKLVERTRREPMTSEMLRRFTAEAPYVRNIPRPLGLRTKPGFAFTGDMTAVHGLIRAVLGQLATFHGPDHLGIVVVTQHPARWDWLKWLPHAGDPDRTDGAGRARMVFSSPAEFDAAYDLNNSRGGFSPVQDSGHGGGANASDKRHWIVIDDEYDDTDGWDGITRGRSGIEATTFLRLAAKPGSGVGWEPDTTFEVTTDGRIVTGTGDDAQFMAHADILSVHDATVLARALAKWDIGKGSVKTFSAGKELGFLDAVRMDDPRNPEVARLWSARENPDSPQRSKFPLGRYRNGTLLEMNLNDVSGIPRGWGGHGIIIGATGSGKSWSLLTYGAGLISTHSPDIMNLIILDWKGRSFGRRLADAPHTVAVLSNLGKDSEFVERMRDVLEGELQRRQELIELVNVGRNDIESVDSYEKARIKEGKDWEPIAELVIIVDEFTELFTMYPTIVEAFVQIGRLGRSLKVRLVLASQVFEESKIKGLEDHIGWKIALRAFNDSASRAFIGTTDAAKLPEDGGGGRGFLKIGEGDLQEIQIFDVGSQWTPPTRKVEKKSAPVSVDYVKPQQFSLTPVPMPALPSSAASKPAATSEEVKPDIDKAVGALVDVVVAGLKPHKPKHRHEMWLRPLREPFSVEWLYEKCYGQPWEENYGAHGDPSMIIPIGLVDRPRDHAQDVLTWDFGPANVGLVGEPQTGRTSTTMSAMLSLAMRYSPQQVQFVGLGFGGPGLSMLADLPHVAGIYGAHEREGVNRACAEILNLIAQREESFPAYGINVKEWRLRRLGLSKGPVPDDGFGEVFFFVDNWKKFREDFERIHDSLNVAMGTSASYGVHIMGTGSAWLSGGLQKSITDNMKLKAELFLSDPSMSEVNRAAAKKIPRNEQDQGTPGRGITFSGEHMMYAYPMAQDGADAVALVQKIIARAGSEKPARVRNLPNSISLAEIWKMPATPADHKDSIRFGLSESDLGPARIDFADTPNFAVLGNTESGRSATIRAIATGIMSRYTPEQASIYMVDVKRDQLGVVMGDHLARYCHRPDQLFPAINELKEELTARIPAEDLDQTQLMAARWEGKRIFVIIDDLNALSTAMMELDPLADFIDYAKDIGLHVIVGAGTAEFGRLSMISTLMNKLVNTQTPGLILDGNRQDGPIIGGVVAERQRKGRGIHVSTKANAVNTAALVGWIDPPKLPEPVQP